MISTDQSENCCVCFIVVSWKLFCYIAGKNPGLITQSKFFFFLWASEISLSLVNLLGKYANFINDNFQLETISQH